MKPMLRRLCCAAAVLLMAANLAACSSGSDPSGGLQELMGKIAAGERDTEAPGNIPFKAKRGEENVQLSDWGDGISGDETHLQDGFLCISAKNEKKMIVQAVCGEQKYNYQIRTDGSTNFIPLQMGNGSYLIRIMENVEGNRYVQLQDRSLEVQTEAPESPFLHPNIFVNYHSDSACVKLAESLAEGCGTELEYVRAVFDYVASHITYDDELAATVEDGYIPDPDRTLQRGKGICFDYGSLTAAMLRSQGIPTKLITGYVGSDGFYHAWNAVYTRDEGWITYEIRLTPQKWNRIDITFAVTGDASDGGKYIDRYEY